MKANEIKVGGIYRARISGNFVDVRVDAIRETTKRGWNNYSGQPTYHDAVVYDVTNLTTGRRTTFKTAGKFRREVKPAVTPGRRPNECPNPELEVLLRQVSPSLNRMVEPTPESEAFEQAFDEDAATETGYDKLAGGWIS